MTLKKDEALLDRTLEAWNSLSDFRQKRLRHKGFAYGRQWDDDEPGPAGRRLTNNLIRQLLKGVIGRWLYLQRESESASNSVEIYRDARALEEFLISGCALQRLEMKGGEVTANNISPDRLFFSSFAEPDAGDAQFIGILHDMSLHEVIGRFSEGDPERAISLASLGRNMAQPLLTTDGERISFSRPARSGTVRVIEVWERETRVSILAHDRDFGQYFRLPASRSLNRLLLTTNRSRIKQGLAGVKTAVGITSTMRHTWLTPEGEVLSSRLMPHDEPIPLAVRLYPFIDGEIHSLVEDVAGQQQCVNRLVTLLDGILDASAKGVLLFPTDQLPEGFTWSDMRRIWASPGGILPYKRTSKTVAPKQIYSPGSCTGATDLLNLQLKLFDEISGMTSSMRSRSGTAGAEALRLEMENSTVAMLDLLGAFGMFTARRDKIAKRLTGLTGSCTH